MTVLLQSMEKSNGVLATNLNPNFEDGTMFANDNELILYGYDLDIFPAFGHK